MKFILLYISLLVMVFAPRGAVASPKIDGHIAATEYQNEIAAAPGTFYIFYTVKDTVIYFGLHAKTNGWVAIGFEPKNIMKNADMIIGRVLPSGKAEVWDAFSTGLFGPHTEDIKLGGSDNLINFAGSEKHGWTDIEFCRELNTHDKFDKIIVPDTFMKMIWATGVTDDLYKKHNHRGKLIIKLKGNVLKTNTKTKIWPFHAILMSVSLILLTIGAVIAKRKNDNWFIRHKNIQTIGFLLALFGGSIALVMNYVPNGKNLSNLHPLLGALTVLFILVTFVFGKSIIKFKQKRHLRKIHKIFALLTLLLMLITALFGIALVF